MTLTRTPLLALVLLVPLLLLAGCGDGDDDDGGTDGGGEPLDRAAQLELLATLLAED